MDTLIEEKTKLLALLNNTLQALVLLGRDCTILTYNTRAEEMYHHLSGNHLLTGKPIIEFLPEDYLETFRREMEKVFQGETVTGIRSVGGSDGRKRWYRYNYTPASNQDGKVDMVTCGILDITEEKEKSDRDHSEAKRYENRLKQSLKEKEYMLQEIHHRVKNNMAVITGLLSLQSDNIEDATIKRYYQESENRIRSIAMIHEQLYHSENFAAIEIGSYIEDLAQMISLQTGRPDIEIEINAKDVYLNINSAVPCGLIIHELLTNSYMHAFKGKNEGHITVSFSHIGDRYCLVIEDDGIGLPDGSLEAQDSKQLGLNLVQGLTRQLNGTLDFTTGKGTKITLKFDTL